MTRLSVLSWALLPGLLGAALTAQAEKWPAPIKALESQGVEVVGRFDAPGGLKGYAGLMGQQPLALYLTPDGKQVIVGTMLDAKGTNLSQAPLDKLVSKPMTAKVWSQLEKTSWIGDGSKTAARVVYTFTDPNCPYCNKFWKDAQPWVKAGKVQVRHILVGILAESSPGKAAALLSADDPSAALAQHEQQQAGGGIKPLPQMPAKARAQLDAHQALMQQLGASATPTTFYKDDAGKLQMVQGAPQGDTLAKLLGPR